MTTEELEKIDMELFKLCYPNFAKFRVYEDYFVYDNGEFFPVDLPRFTKSPTACFSVLIPEMNRRDWELIELHQKINEDGICVQWDATFRNIITMKEVDGRWVLTKDESGGVQTAICLAAIKAIKSMEAQNG